MIEEKKSRIPLQHERRELDLIGSKEIGGPSELGTVSVWSLPVRSANVSEVEAKAILNRARVAPADFACHLLLE